MEALEETIIKACLVVVICSGIPIAVAGMGGLVAALVQTATQVQEQSLSYLIRLGGMLLVLALCGRWLVSLLSEFLSEILTSLPVSGFPG